MINRLMFLLTDDDGSPSDFTETVTIAVVILAGALFILWRVAPLTIG